MEQLYPQNIVERHFPILRERREREEREALDERLRTPFDLGLAVEDPEVALYENDPMPEGAVGNHLNTLA